MTGLTNGETSMRLDRDRVLKGVRNLPSLPTVVIELLQSMDNEDADTRQLAGKLARDQALSAKVLRVANSSFYGLRGKVDSIGAPSSCSACTACVHWPRQRRLPMSSRKRGLANRLTTCSDSGDTASPLRSVPRRLPGVGG